MGDRRTLFEIADSQQGYFTTRQAEEAGFRQSHFQRRLQSGEWVREGRGIYRLTLYSTAERPELVLWSLWSHNREGVPQGVWSHDTALDIFDLSDVMPERMHMTMPSHFRRRSPIPKILHLYYADLPPQDVREQQGYRVTTPLRTLRDVIKESKLHDGLISQAIRQAWQRGLFLWSELLDLQTDDPNTYLKIMVTLHDKNV